MRRAALFVVVLAAILALLLHFSLVLSRLSVQNKILAQRLAATQGHLEEIELRLASADAIDVPEREPNPSTLVE